MMQPLKRRLPFPAIAAIASVTAVAIWGGLRLFDSQGTPTSARVESTEFVIPGPVAARAAKSASLAAAAGTPAMAPAPVVSAPPLAAAHSVLHEELPDIPQKARDTIHGRILFAVHVTVDQSGNVVRAAIENTRSSKYFARLSTEAAMKWKFAPAGNAAARRRLLLFELTRKGVTVRAT
jgi:outer membrane biosynthesis protein TonB